MRSNDPHVANPALEVAEEAAAPRGESSRAALVFMAHHPIRLSLAIEAP